MLYIIFLLLLANLPELPDTRRAARRSARTAAVARKTKAFQEACCLLKGNGKTEVASLPFADGEEARVLEYRFNTRRYDEYRRPRHGSQDGYRHGNKCRSIKEDRELAAAKAKLSEFFAG